MTMNNFLYLFFLFVLNIVVNFVESLEGSIIKSTIKLCLHLAVELKKKNGSYC